MKAKMSIAALAGIALLAPTSAGALAAGEESSEEVVTVTSNVTEVDKDPKGSESGEGGINQPQGTFKTRGDYPHLSSGDTSAHGWWVNQSTSATYADVHVTLQALTENGWHTVDTGEKRVLSGGGRGQRANARVDCVDSRLYKYRSIIDVDLVGVVDDYSKAYSYSPTNLPCGFAW
ncbi:hypothetical protein [uncultured Serinicoccus sp.]|uniref:hypothetical protein n=1 Tax=uncultured Serinicoccus sp. TaxID=735514 RepID=UPI0026147B87|nr:hypothetical protein [uncultured Serinicoccus sp.]